MGFVTLQLVQPYRDRPNEGTLAVYAEFSPMADPSFEAGRPAESAVELGRMIDRGLRNLVDAANIAALLTFRRPECTLGGDDDQEVIICAPEAREALPLAVHHLPMAITFAFIGDENTVVKSYNTERALRKIKRHPPSAVVDVIKAGEKGADNLLKENMEKPKLKIEGTSVSQSNDMDIETQSSKQSERKTRTDKYTSFIGAPSSWDPYSKGVDADKLKTSLASRVAATPPRKMDTVPLVEPQLTIMDPRLPSMNATRSSEETTGAGQQMNKKKTLKDAVKPKHKRKKMSANTDAS